MGVKDAPNAEKWKNFLNNVKEKAGLSKAAMIRLCFKDSNGVRHELKDFQDLYRVQVEYVQKGDANSDQISLTLHLEVLGNTYQEFLSRFRTFRESKNSVNENGDSSNPKNQPGLGDLPPIEVRTIVIRKNFSQAKSQSEFEKVDDKPNDNEKDQSMPKAQYNDEWLATQPKEEKVPEEKEKSLEKEPSASQSNNVVGNNTANNQIESNVNVRDTESKTTVYISNIPKAMDINTLKQLFGVNTTERVFHHTEANSYAITYDTPERAKYAAFMNGQKILNEIIRVEVVDTNQHLAKLQVNTGKEKEKEKEKEQKKNKKRKKKRRYQKRSPRKKNLKRKKISPYRLSC